MKLGKFGRRLLPAVGSPFLIIASAFAESDDSTALMPALNAPSNHIRPDIVGPSLEKPPRRHSERSPVDIAPRLAVAKKSTTTASRSAKVAADASAAQATHANENGPDLRSLLNDLRKPNKESADEDAAVETAVGKSIKEAALPQANLAPVVNPAGEPIEIDAAIDSSSKPADIEVEIEKLLEDNDTTPKATEELAPTDDDNGPTATADEPAASTESAAAATPAKPFTPSRAVIGLQMPLQRCLAMYDHQYVNTQDNACWSTMHSVLAHGHDARIHVGGFGASTSNAVDWLCQNRPCSGRQILYVENGELQGRTGPGFQGHDAQLLAILAQIQTPADKPLIVDGQQFTIMDLVRSEQQSCREGAELTFKLIGLLQYLPSDAEWESDDGVQWDFPKLIRAELSEPINGAACGGTHRIMAVSHAALKRKYRGEEMVGDWWRAEKYMKDYQQYAFSLQNPDGSFSSDWFKKRANWGDADRQIQTTGHILEWLVYSLPDEQMNDPRLVRSVAFLTNLMIANRYHEWEEGPKGHAIRALNLYYQRAFGARHISSEPHVYRRPPRSKSNERDSVFTRLRNRFK